MTGVYRLMMAQADHRGGFKTQYVYLSHTNCIKYKYKNNTNMKRCSRRDLSNRFVKIDLKFILQLKEGNWNWSFLKTFNISFKGSSVQLTVWECRLFILLWCSKYNGKLNVVEGTCREFIRTYIKTYEQEYEELWKEEEGLLYSTLKRLKRRKLSPFLYKDL